MFDHFMDSRSQAWKAGTWFGAVKRQNEQSRQIHIISR